MCRFFWHTIITESTACNLSFLCFSNSSVKCRKMHWLLNLFRAFKFVLFLLVCIVLKASPNFDVTHTVQTQKKERMRKMTSQRSCSNQHWLTCIDFTLNWSIWLTTDNTYTYNIYGYIYYMYVLISRQVIFLKLLIFIKIRGLSPLTNYTSNKLQCMCSLYVCCAN